MNLAQSAIPRLNIFFQVLLSSWLVITACSTYCHSCELDIPVVRLMHMFTASYGMWR